MPMHDDQNDNRYEGNGAVDGDFATPRVNLIVGSLWQSLVEYPRLIENSYCLVIDVSSEIESLLIHPATRKPIQLQKSGRNFTIKSLAERYGTEEQRLAMEQMPNMSLEDGIGQVRGYGAMAVREVMVRHDYQQFKRQLPGLLLSAAGGELPRVILNSYFGIAGGQASWGGQLVFEDILATLLDETNATVDASVHLVGGISFTGPGFARTQANSSAAIAQWLHLNNHLPGNRVNLTMYLGELAPVKKNTQLRTQLLLDRHNALAAPEVEANIQVMRANRAAGGPYGNIMLLRSDQFRGISKVEVVREVAGTYLPELVRVMKADGNAGQFDGIYFQYEHKGKSRASVERALDQALQSGDVSQLRSLVLARRGTQATPILLVRSGDEEIVLSELREYFTRPVTTSPEARSRIEFLRGAIRLVGAEILDLRSQFNQLESHLQRTLEQCESLFQASLRRSGGKHRQSLLEGLRQARDIHDVMEEMYGELRSLGRAEMDLEKELEDFVHRLRRLVVAVKKCGSQASAPKREPWIRPLPLKSRLGELLAIADTMGEDERAVFHALSTMTGYVTLEGLARITGAKSASVESVVAEVTSRRHVRKGPNWGGAAREDQCDAFLVYPPVEPAVKERLLQRHAQQGQALHLISFATRADCSVNVSFLELRTVSHLREILTPHYTACLTGVLANGDRSLFLSDPEIVKDLGFSGVDAITRGAAKPVS